MTNTFYRTSSNNFGGRIYELEDDAYTSMSDMAATIGEELKFAEKCRKYREAKELRKAGK